MKKLTTKAYTIFKRAILYFSSLFKYHKTLFNLYPPSAQTSLNFLVKGIHLKLLSNNSGLLTNLSSFQKEPAIPKTKLAGIYVRLSLRKLYIFADIS